MNKLPREVELKILIDDCNIECCSSQIQLRDPDITIAEMKRLESRYENALQKREEAYLELYKLEETK